MPEQKAVYDANYFYMPVAINLDAETNSALAPIFADYLAYGYSPNDISSIMHRVVFDLAMEAIISTNNEKGHTK